jgi:hypothetical protein
LVRAGIELTNRGGRLYANPLPSDGAVRALRELYPEVLFVLKAKTVARQAIAKAVRTARRREAEHG